MAYQELTIVKAVKAGIIDSDSRRVVWNPTDFQQGMKFANDGKTILYAVNKETPAHGKAEWEEEVPAGGGTYSAKLTKAGDADGSIHLQFIPTAHVVTLQDLYDAITDGLGATLDPVYSFWHKDSTHDGNFGQFELRFEDPVSTAWIEVTILPCQGLSGPIAWEEAQVAGTTIVVFGGNTINGSSVWAMGALTLAGLNAAVDNAWDTAEEDTVPTDYELKRVRVELWEADPADRTANIDNVWIDGHEYEVEPGLEGVEIGPNTDILTLEFVEVPDRFGRLEVLNPILGASQAVIVGPLLPELFNDSDGFARFKPIVVATGNPATGLKFTYVAIQVTDPS